MQALNIKTIFKIFLIVLGTISLVLGIIGIFVPLLPTTPFILLAAALYVRSSDRMYRWLIKNKLFGKLIQNYQEGNGIPVKTKIIAISILWVSVLFSIFLFIPNWLFRILLIIIATAVSILIISIKKK